jgi:hypothetical protein
MDDPRLALGGQRAPDLGRGDGWIDGRSEDIHQGKTLSEVAREIATPVRMLTPSVPVGLRVDAGLLCSGSRLGQSIQDGEEPTQALGVEQVVGERRGIVAGLGISVGAAASDGNVAAVGSSDDEIGIDARSATDDLDALTAEGMAGMGDRHKARIWRG